MLMFSTDPRKLDRSRSVLTLVLLAVVLIVPAVIMNEKSATFDEVTHLPAGYSYLVERSIRYNPQHPPLIKEICALPLLSLDLRYPENPSENEWSFGRDFLFRQDAQRILFWGRVPALLLSLGLASLVTMWATQLWGWWGGLLALFLYAFDPTITAHSQLVATDVGVACFSVLYLWGLRCYLQNPTWKILLFSGAALGLALGAKFSAVVLVPISVALLAIAACSARRNEALTPSCATSNLENHPPRISFWRNLVALSVMTLVAAFIVWAAYFFPKDPLFYWKGIQTVNRDRGVQPYFYLLGTLKPGGWKTYLLIAWLVKTPIPSLLLTVAAVVMSIKGWRTTWFDEAFLVVPAVGYFFFYSMFADNIGVRYLIPCFPFLYIFIGRVVQGLRSASLVYKLLFSALLAWNVSEYVAIAPDHLSYFNQIAGGADNGMEWLSDSNLDWGQGLIQLRRFLEEQKISDYAFFYFGTADPAYYGIRGRRIEGFDFVIRPTRGVVIMSSHLVTRARDVLDRVFGNGPLNWLRRQEPVHIVGHAYYVYEIR
jgi:dolichyl-phosphate-mannose-protein mannosyltransferase